MIVGKIFLKSYDKIKPEKKSDKLMNFETYFIALSDAQPIKTKTDDAAESLWGLYVVGETCVWAKVQEVDEKRMELLNATQNEIVEDIELSMVASKKPLAELSGFGDGKTLWLFDLPNGKGFRHFEMRDVIERKREILAMDAAEKRQLRYDINLFNVACENNMIALFGNKKDKSAYALFADATGRCHRFTRRAVEEARSELGLDETLDFKESENA